jgi:hypothetical protein
MDDTEDYAIGYGKPPKHSQFQKGRSGNPGGRKRTIATNAHSALATALARRVTVRDDDGAARMSQLEALMGELVRKARAGDTRCLKLVLERLQALESSEEAKEEFEGLCRKAARDDGRGCADGEIVSSSAPAPEN